MDRDAQKVYTLSWEKIVTSRAAKAGMNLHKTLLVSGVLLKAKSFMLCQSFCEYRDPSSKPAAVSAPKDGVHSEVSKQQESAGSSDESCQVNMTEEKTNDCIFQTEESDGDKENLSVCEVIRIEDTSVQTKDKLILTECSQCNKRSRSDEEDTNPLPIKRQCVDSQESESMDCSNISALVNSFDSGFTGLLNNACPPPQDSDPLNYSQGLSEGFSSCSTQIKESFDALSPSPIFLTV